MEYFQFDTTILADAQVENLILTIKNLFCSVCATKYFGLSNGDRLQISIKYANFVTRMGLVGRNLLLAGCLGLIMLSKLPLSKNNTKICNIFYIFTRLGGKLENVSFWRSFLTPSWILV